LRTGGTGAGAVAGIALSGRFALVMPTGGEQRARRAAVAVTGGIVIVCGSRRLNITPLTDSGGFISAGRISPPGIRSRSASSRSWPPVGGTPTRKPKRARSP